MAILVMDDRFDPGVLAGASCAFGVFDGLHLGHRYLLDEAMRTAGADGRSLAITFDIDPDEIFHPERLKKLMRNADRLAALAASGVDDVVVLPFTEEFRSRDPEAFLASAFRVPYNPSRRRAINVSMHTVAAVGALALGVMAASKVAPSAGSGDSAQGSFASEMSQGKGRRNKSDRSGSSVNDSAQQSVPSQGPGSSG